MHVHNLQADIHVQQLQNIGEFKIGDPYSLLKDSKGIFKAFLTLLIKHLLLMKPLFKFLFFLFGDFKEAAATKARWAWVF